LEWDPARGRDPARPAAFPLREAASPRQAGGHSRDPFPAARRDPEAARRRGLFRAGPPERAAGAPASAVPACVRGPARLPAAPREAREAAVPADARRSAAAPASAVPACVRGPARLPAAPPEAREAAVPADARRSAAAAAVSVSVALACVRGRVRCWMAAIAAAAARARASGPLSGEDPGEFRPTAAAVGRARTRRAAAPESRAARPGGAPDPEAGRMSEAEMPAGPVRSARLTVAVVAAREPVRSEAPVPDVPDDRARPEERRAPRSPGR
jgi:hypothetical protein